MIPKLSSLSARRMAVTAPARIRARARSGWKWMALTLRARYWSSEHSSPRPGLVPRLTHTVSMPGTRASASSARAFSPAA